MAEISTAELEQAWKERCQRGNFSAAIIGLGTIRVMGRSGDAAVQFPRITSLAALGELEPDEQYAVQVAQRIIEQARQQSRTVFAVQPAVNGVTPAPERVSEFDPAAESLMVVARIAGGQQDASAEVPSHGALRSKLARA